MKEAIDIKDEQHRHSWLEPMHSVPMNFSLYFEATTKILPSLDPVLPCSKNSIRMGRLMETINAKVKRVGLIVNTRELPKAI